MTEPKRAGRAKAARPAGARRRQQAGRPRSGGRECAKETVDSSSSKTRFADGGRGLLTVPLVCAELRISRSTFYDWRTKGRAPRCVKLPNGRLRVRRADLDRWLTEHEG